MPTFICIMADDIKSKEPGSFNVKDTRGRNWTCCESELPDSDFAQVEGEQTATSRDPDDLQLGSVVSQQRYETCERLELPARLSIDMESLPEGE